MNTEKQKSAMDKLLAELKKYFASDPSDEEINALGEKLLAEVNAALSGKN